MTAAIRLIASVSPLVMQRSARTWTAWLGSAGDPASAITATLRASVTPAMLASPRPLPLDAPRRTGSIRSERDRLAADLQAARQEIERELGSATARIDELTAARDRLAADLQAAREDIDRVQGSASAQQGELTAERDRLAAELLSARDEIERERSARAIELERERSSASARCDDLVAELQAARDDLERERSSASARIDELTVEHDRLTADVALAIEEREYQRRTDAERIDELTVERDRLTRELQAAHEARKNSYARTKALVAEHDRLAADLHAATERHRIALVGRDREQEQAAATVASLRAELAQAQRECADANHGARSRNERIKALADARDHLKAELEQQVQRFDLLREEITTAEAAVKEQTSRADAALQRAATLDARRRDLEAELAAAIAERDRRMSSLTSAKTSLTLARTELEGCQSALAKEKAAHTGTRQSLAFVDDSQLKLLQDHQQLAVELSGVTQAAQELGRALAQICEWLNIDTSEHADVESQVEAILTAIDHQQSSRQELLNRAEDRLLRHVRDACERLYMLQCYRHAHPGSNFDAQVERNLAGIHKTADEIVRKDMARLTAFETKSA
ncbi:MAG: hypothetical protein R3B09_29390 [Nannocystaceae bacterium]